MKTPGRAYLAAALGAWLAWSGAAQASPGCGIRDVTGIQFGRYDPISNSPVLTVGGITLCCEGPGLADLVSVDLGAGASGNTSARAMTAGADKLLYNLYMDRGLTQLWGDGFDGTSHTGPLRPPDGGCSNLPVYGYMPAHQAARAGDYTDTLTITLSF